MKATAWIDGPSLGNLGLTAALTWAWGHEVVPPRLELELPGS